MLVIEVRELLGKFSLKFDYSRCSNKIPECCCNLLTFLPQRDEIMCCHFGVANKSVKRRNINAYCVHSKFVCLDQSSPTPTEWVKHNVTRLKVDFPFKIVSMGIQKICYELWNKFAFVGM